MNDTRTQHADGHPSDGSMVLEMPVSQGKLTFMHNRFFPKLGRAVSEVGLGCWQLGGDVWGSVTADTAEEILEEAVLGGVTFFDTADVYGDGESERIVGRFLARHPGCVVATKAGRRGIYPDRITRETLGGALDASLQRLGVERIDLLQLHCVPTGLLRDGEVFTWLSGFRDAGKIAAYGASIETIEEGLLCLRDPGLASLQVIFNVLRQRAAAELFPLAEARGVAIIVRLPLASGLLSGGMTADRRFAVSDHRHFNRDGQAFNVGETFAGLPFEKGVELVNGLRKILPAEPPLPLLAQRWILDHPSVTTMITGATRPEQAARNASTSLLPPLSPAIHEQLTAFYAARVHEHIRGPY
jgi:aryl-alcohol dehydrogenase-like predicted oxidoreductase